MCGVFGFLTYGEAKDFSNLSFALGIASQVRGTDATGVSYLLDDKKLTIDKAAVSAWNFTTGIPEVKAVMGHVRAATQGSAHNNYNNHPFPGQMVTGAFALAHNGVIYNDSELREEEALPETSVETDSYVAVQLLEKEKKLTLDTLGVVGEKLEGSFMITVLDSQGDLYFMKQDNPIAIAFIPSEKLYVYASTMGILQEALELYDTTLLDKTSRFIEMKRGDLLQIRHDGTLKWGKFTPKRQKTVFAPWYSRTYCEFDGSIPKDLMEYAEALGYTEEDIQFLYDYGFYTYEIEEMLLSGEAEIYLFDR